MRVLLKSLEEISKIEGVYTGGGDYHEHMAIFNHNDWDSVITPLHLELLGTEVDVSDEVDCDGDFLTTDLPKVYAIAIQWISKVVHDRA